MRRFQFTVVQLLGFCCLAAIACMLVHKWMKHRELKNAVRDLLAAVERNDQSKAEQAMETIRRHHAIEAAIGALMDDCSWEPQHWKYAAETMRGLGAEAVPPLIRLLKEDRRSHPVIESLGRIGSPGIPALVTALADDDWNVRVGAAEALGKADVDAQTVVPSLETALQDVNSDVRLSAAVSLSRIRQDPGWLVGFLRELLKSDHNMDSAVFNALREVGPEAVPFLIGALHDGDAEVRYVVADVLLRYTDPNRPGHRAIAEGLKAKGDPREYLRKIRRESKEIIEDPGFK